MRKRRRIMIVGQPGSGKSTLARILGSVLDLPVVHIDHIHWQAGWIERSGAEKDRLCAEVHARERWIFEGGRSSTWNERLERADTLVWLDVPLALRAWRVFMRTLRHRGQNRLDLPEGCPERFDWEFTVWIWKTRKSGRTQMHALYDSAPNDVETYRLQRLTQVDAFVAGLREGCARD